jgi:hypothetical protein
MPCDRCGWLKRRSVRLKARFLFARRAGIQLGEAADAVRRARQVQRKELSTMSASMADEHEGRRTRRPDVAMRAAEDLCRVDDHDGSRGAQGNGGAVQVSPYFGRFVPHDMTVLVDRSHFCNRDGALLVQHLRNRWRWSPKRLRSDRRYLERERSVEPPPRRPWRRTSSCRRTAHRISSTSPAAGVMLDLMRVSPADCSSAIS